VPYDRLAEPQLGVALEEARLPERLGVEPPELLSAVAQARRAGIARDGSGDNGKLEALLVRAPESERQDAEAALDALLSPSVAEGRLEEQRFAQARDAFGALLRGREADRAEFLRSYEYDLSPSTDDAPFFFNYYRYSGLLGGASVSAGATSAEGYHADYPVGHMVLLSSLVQITALAALLVLLPLRWLARSGVAPDGRWRLLAYFSALGVGFMFVEIVLMQKMVLFLGHPTYAVTVVLTSLLAAAGFGALAAGRLGLATRNTLVGLLAAIMVAIVAVSQASELLLPDLLGLAFGARVAVVVGLLAPLGFVLGMPFPLGIRFLGEACPELVPWAWAVNGFLSVFASIFCVVLAMNIGFGAVLMLGLAIYAGGFLAMLGVLPAAVDGRG